MLLDALENLPYAFDSIGARLDNAALLHRAGVRIAFTQFNESHNARKVRQLAGNAVAHGLPKDAALAALTVQPAEIFGLGAARPHRTRPGRGSRALERRPARSNERGRPGVDRRTPRGDALAPDRAAGPLLSNGCSSCRSGFSPTPRSCLPSSQTRTTAATAARSCRRPTLRPATRTLSRRRRACTARERRGAGTGSARSASRRCRACRR